MSIRNLKDGSKKPWLCECYPNGRRGKRVRKRFTTKGEAVAYELHLMKKMDDKPWMGSKPDSPLCLTSLTDGIHTMDGHS